MRHAELRPNPASSYLGVLLPFMLGVVLFFLALYWLLQPKVYANPGLVAYKPPAGTNMLPLPRKLDAPALAELQPLLEPSPPVIAKVEAGAEESGRESKVQHKQPRKRHIVRQQRRYAYPQQAYGYRPAWQQNPYRNDRGWDRRW
jgi:hypothetical protein